ncbi:MAG: HlyC/CorC family transporter [Lachnospiraceae bacterium]|nr:HlyC/CorC family transporter [Lachnospiraceae bacterium]
MGFSDIVPLLCLLILLLLSSFCSSAETALTCVNQIRIKTLAEEGSRRAATLLRIFEERDKMLSAILIANNVVNLSASALTAAAAIRLFGNAYVGLATGILTFLVILFGEITPKTRAMLKAEAVSLRAAYLIRGLMTVLTPVIFLINHLSRFFLRLTGTDPDEKPEAITESEFRTIVEETHKDGVLETDEKQMINNVVDLGDTEAVDIMIPWIDVTSAGTDATYDELIDIFRENRFTRLPIFEDENETVVGILNMKDLLLVDREDFRLDKVMREAYFTFEHKKLSGLLSEMRANSQSIVIVIDEYGTTSGIITMENVLEEIVGDIQDEYKGRDVQEINVIAEGKEYSCLGSMSLDDCNEATGLKLESEEYETVGGYIIEHSEDKLPLVGEYVTTEDGARLIVEAVRKRRITRVHIYIGEQEEK